MLLALLRKQTLLEKLQRYASPRLDPQINFIPLSKSLPLALLGAIIVRVSPTYALAGMHIKFYIKDISFRPTQICFSNFLLWAWRLTLLSVLPHFSDMHSIQSKSSVMGPDSAIYYVHLLTEAMTHGKT